VKVRNEVRVARLQFRQDSYNIDPKFKNNESELATVSSSVEVVKTNPDLTITGIYITGYASPEGTVEYNLKLSKNRAEALAAYAQKDTEVDASLWHVSLNLRLCDNFFHENLAQELTVSVLLLIACSAFLLEHEDFVVLQVLKNLTFYRGAFYYRCTYLDLTVVVCKQDLVETHRRIFFAGKTVDIEFPTFFSFELLTCNLYYNVH
jgi:hypothetical protein